MLRKSCLFVSLVCFTLPSCSSAPSADVAPQIRARYQELIETVSQRRDPEIAVGMHTDDAILVPPDGSVLQGRDAVRRTFAAGAGARIHDTRIDSVRIDGDGDLAYDVGRYQYTLADASGESVVRGRYLMIWRRVDGVWQLEVDMWDVER